MSVTRQGWLRGGFVSGVAFVAVAAAVARGATDGIDGWWNDRMVDAETEVLVRVAEVFATLGSVRIAVVIAAVAVVVLASFRRWREAIAVASMAVVATVIGQLTKVVVDRPRPPAGLEIETSASFPSASVMVSAAAIVLGTAVVISNVVPWRAPPIIWCAIGYVVVMAWSRTYLRVHWLFDVVGGAVGGAAVVALVVGLLLRRGLVRGTPTVSTATNR